MKGFLAAIMFLIMSALFFTSLPGDIFRRIRENDIPDSIKERIGALVTTRIFPQKNTAEKRRALIDEIEKAITAAKEELFNTSPSSGEAEAANAADAPPRFLRDKRVEELLNEAENRIQELRIKNTDEGVVRNTAARILDAVLPSEDACLPEKRK